MTTAKDRRKIRNNKRQKKKKGCLFLLLFIIIFIIICIASFMSIRSVIISYFDPARKVEILESTMIPDWIDVQLIDIDETSRQGIPLEAVKDIVIHYTGNPGTTAQQNRNYYNNPNSTVSSHFVIGLDGEIILCVPLYEKSSATNWRNIDTISIEVCHPDETGKFTQASYDSLVRLTSWLSDICNLNKTHIIRHYDVTEKECPRYFVQNEDQWEKFKEDVEQYGS